jgi:hypothetical protein
MTSFDATGAALPVKLSFQVVTDVTGDIKTHWLVSGLVGRSLTGAVTALNTTAFTPAITSLTAGSVSYDGSITGNITNEYGPVTDVGVVSGDIGSSGSHVNIQAALFNGNIEANSIYAEIGATSGGMVPSFNYLETFAGNFEGSLTMADWGSVLGTRGLLVAGDLAADVVIAGSLPSGINISAGGNITNQISINAAGGSSTWVGTVSANGSGLMSPPYYTDTSSHIGGGSVGLVPFHLHDSDCDPPPSSAACEPTFSTRAWPAGFGGGTRQTIILRHYGPVFNSNAEVVPLVVYRESLTLCTPDPCEGDEPYWTDDTSLFDIYVPGGGSREVWIAYKLVGGEPVDFTYAYQFDIDLVTSDSHPLLRSDDTLASPAPDVAGYPYMLNPICDVVPPPSSGG